MGRQGMMQDIVEKPERKGPIGRPRHKWWTILKWILERLDGVV
jgi:hypothetical protein